MQGRQEGDFRTDSCKEMTRITITYVSAKYFAKFATKLFHILNAIEGLVTIHCIAFKYLKKYYEIDATCIYENGMLGIAGNYYRPGAGGNLVGRSVLRCR